MKLQQPFYEEKVLIPTVTAERWGLGSSSY